MGNHKAKLGGQTVSGNFLHVHAVNVRNNAFLAHILAHVTVENDALTLLHKLIGGRGHDQYTVSFRNLCIIQRGRRCQNIAVNAFGGKGLCGGLGACASTHNAVGVAVNLRDNDLTILAGQCGSGFNLLLGLVSVQLIHVENKAAVLLQGKLLGAGVQISDRAVTAEIVADRTSTAIVLHIINQAYAAGKSRKTLQLLCADLRSFCKFCRKSKLSTFIPEELTIPAGARYKGKAILQPSDLVTLFSTDTTVWRGKTIRDEYINAYRFQVLTGLRPGELIGLKWADISGNTVRVGRAVNIQGQVTSGKNDNALRAFVLSDMAAQVLDDQRRQTDGQESVFCVLKEKSYYDRWKAYCRANNLTPCSLYELRHTFVSVVKTLPAGEVKSLVGHSADMDTFGTYSHELTGDAEHTAQAVNGVFLRVLKQA